jgi:drug/metabolite transporter (DMT)-like permease
MVGVAVIFLALWPTSGIPTMPPRQVWPAILMTGVLASALAYFIQTAAQRVLTTVRTAVVLTTEPLFAAVFGYLLAGERLNSVQMAGAALILVAVVLSEVVPAALAAPR